MSKSIIMKSLNFEIPSGKTEGEVVYKVPFEMEFHGISLYFEGTKFGDQASFDVLHPVVGVIKSYIQDGRIDLPGEISHIEIKVGINDEPSTLLAGLSIRFQYFACDTNGRKCILWLRTKQ